MRRDKLFFLRDWRTLDGLMWRTPRSSRLGRLLLVEDGVRWDGNLGARGVVVSDHAAADAIVLAGAIDYQTVQLYHKEICLLFTLDSDLVLFDLYVPAPDKAGLRSRIWLPVS